MLASRGGMLRILVSLVFVSSLAAAEPAPVIGGSRVPSGAWSDVVAVIAPDGTCTGVLVAPDVVLTAGHCIELRPTHVITNTVDHAAGGDRIAVKWARAYPTWWERYDAGVLVLEHVARGRARPIASACLANDRLRAGAPLRVVGFGATTPAGTDDNTQLYEATIAVLDPFCETDPACGDAARPKGELTAGGRGTDACFGDSGGPAYLDTPAGPTLLGIVSRGLEVLGLPCGNGGVYVRADKLVAWIEAVTDRDLERAPCDAPADTIEAAEEGGCTTGGGAGLGIALVFGVRRRRRARQLPARDRANAPPPPSIRDAAARAPRSPDARVR